MFFSLLTLVLTYPLVVNLLTAVPGPPWDNLGWLYDLWWFRHSIVDLKQWPVYNPSVFYPYGYDLRLSETMMANKLLIAPLLFMGNEILAYNGLLLVSFVLTGYTTWLFVTYLTRSQGAGLVAGVVFAFCPYRMHAMAAGWLPLISTQWIPLTFLYLERTLDENKAGHALLAGLFLALNILSSWYYLYIVGSLVALYLLIRLVQQKKLWRRPVLWRNLALLGGTAVLLVLPVALPVLRLGGGAMNWPLSDVEKWAASLEDFVLPNVYHPVWGSDILRLRSFTARYPWYAPGFVYLGLVPLALAGKAFALRGGTTAPGRAFAWLGGVSFVMALGLVLHWGNSVVEVPVAPAVENLFARAMSTLMSKWALHRASYYDITFRSGTIPIPLPALLVYLFLPLGSALRTLYRFGVITVWAVAVLAGLGVAGLLKASRIPETGRTSLHTPPRARGRSGTRRELLRAVSPVAILVALVVFDFVSVPLPYGMSEIRAQPVDAWLSALPSDAVIMQFPLARALNGDAIYRTRYHQKRVAYGHGSFYPEAYSRAMPMLGTFPSTECLDLLQSWGVTHVVVGFQAYDAGWGDLPGQDGESMRKQIAASARLQLVAELEDQPFWRDERVSDILYGGPPVVPVLVDRIRIYELR